MQAFEYLFSYNACMSLYIEYVMIDNLVINTLILLCVKNTLKLKVRAWRLFLSALLGTVVAVVLPLLNISSLLQLPVKIVLGVVMILVLATYLRVKDFIISLVLFVLYTILLAGASMVTLLSFGTSLESLSAGGYDISVPLGLILLIVSLYVAIIIYIARYLTRKKDLSPFLRKVKILIDGRALEFDAFIDSGNKLVDIKTGLPVVVLSITALFKYFSKEEIELLMLMKGKGTIFKNVHYCDYNTISGEAKKMVVFDADKIVINDGKSEYTTNRFVVGITYKKFKDVCKYECLLGATVCLN